MFKGQWVGPKSVSFQIVRVTAEDLKSFLDDRVCGRALLDCNKQGKQGVLGKHPGYFVQASTGACVMVMNCHDASHGNLKATWKGRSIYNGGSVLTCMF